MTTVATDSYQERKTIRAAARLSREFIGTLLEAGKLNPLEAHPPRLGRSVYVLRLLPSVWDCKRCAAKLGAEAGAPAFYIGTTGISVRDRINQHVHGIKSSHMVRAHFAQRAKRMEPRTLWRESLEGRLTSKDAELLELNVFPQLFRLLGLGAHSA